MSAELAVVLPAEGVGGHEHMLLEWLSAARESGLRATLYCRRGSELAELVQRHAFECRSVDYHLARGRTPLARARLEAHNFFQTLRVAAKLPRDWPVLLAPGVVQAGLIHLLACLIAGRKIVYYVPMAYDAATMRVAWPRLRDCVTSKVVAGVRAWITINAEQARCLKEYWKVRVPVLVVPNRLRILSTAALEPRSAAQSAGALRVLYAGRFEVPHKGLDWLCEVLCANREWASGYVFSFQGRGDFQEALEELSRRLGPGHIRIIPWGELAGTLAVHDVLVLTSRFEGFPLVAIEAIWAGIPVVATIESGLAEILIPECLVRFGDSAALQRALDGMQDPQRRRAAVLEARKRLAAMLDPTRYRSAIMGVLAELAAIRGRRSK